MRKLVTIKTITNIELIDNADFIVLATINDSWKVVTKKDEFKIGDECVYFEIDSILPENDKRFSFLMKDVKNLTTENDTIVKGVKLKTIRLKGKLSQGLALPLHLFPELEGLTNDDNLDEILNIQKYEAPVHHDNKNDAKGNFPSFIPKTQQERIQNCYKDIDFMKYEWHISKKYDGCSATYYYNDGQIGICSRNLDLIVDDSKNDVWNKINKQYNILENLTNHCNKWSYNLAIQGEIYGYDIQDNPEKLNSIKFIVFDIYLIDEKKYCNYNEIKAISKMLNLNYCEHQSKYDLECQPSLHDLLDMANGTEWEGLVFKAQSDERISFKVINNNYLLKGK